MSAMFGSPQTELSDGIAVLVASNDHIQEHLSQMEEMCHTIEVSRWEDPGKMPADPTSDL